MRHWQPVRVTYRIALMICQRAHFGVEVTKDLGGKEFQDWIGGYYEHMWSCNPMWSPEFTDFPEHPITRGVKPFSGVNLRRRTLR